MEESRPLGKYAAWGQRVSGTGWYSEEAQAARVGSRPGEKAPQAAWVALDTVLARGQGSPGAPVQRVANGDGAWQEGVDALSVAVCMQWAVTGYRGQSGLGQEGHRAFLPALCAGVPCAVCDNPDPLVEVAEQVVLWAVWLTSVSVFCL